MTAEQFYKTFGEIELRKLKEFCEHYDKAHIKERVLQAWAHKKKAAK